MDSKTYSKRKKIRIILYTATVIIVLGIFGIVQTVKATRYRREAIVTKQMALISLDEYLNNISANLEKTVYVSTPTMLSKLSTELWREASGAKNSLSMLSGSDSSLDNTYKFLSQVGEFVMALQRKSAAGEPITDNEREQLKELNSYCDTLTEQIGRMCFELENGNLNFENTNTKLLNNKTGTPTPGSSIDDAEQSLSDFPSLIYDGPFSDHIEQAQPKLLEGENEISKNTALAVAQNVCADEKDSLKFAYEEGGKIPCYVFQSENCTVGITKKGGKPLYMLNSGYAGAVEIKYEEAIKYGSDFLKKIGYDGLKESYYFTDDGICTVNFAATKDGIVCYPDLIKVSVNLENGNIMAFDATGYVSNHYERTPPDNTISASKAAEKINSYLNIISMQKSVIPNDWGGERFCYEFHCKTDNSQELLVYIDCITGEEDDILILLYSDGGVLTK